MAGADDEGARQRRASTEESKEPPVPAPKRLPKSIQDSLDNEEKLWEVMYEGKPVAHPRLVRGAYAISWLYLGGDVMHEGYKAYLRNQRVLHPESQHDSPEITSSDKHAADRPAQTSLGSGLTGSSVGSLQPHRVVPLEDYRSVMAQRAVFQSLASMGLPAFTIHSIVRYSGRALKNSANKTLRTYGPIGLGLAAVPFLPFVFDKPVEEAVEWTFYTAFKAIGGPGAVGERPVFGRKDLRHQEAREGAEKEKEL
ncbi:MAG: hypothetical protein Q9157_007740 [Trypethelium eluteriae]